MKICSKITKIFQNTKHQISIIAPLRILLQIDKDEIFNNSINDNQDIKINYRFLTQISEQNLNAAKILLSKANRNRSKFEVRVPDLSPELFPKMIIRDNEETLLFISKKTNSKDEACLWTNCKILTKTFMSVFENLWQNATTIQESTKDLESVKSMLPLSYNFKGEYEKALTSAKKEILILTSADGLNQKLNLTPFFEMIAKKGIAIKIMATLTSSNLNVSKELSKFCEIKHVPKGYPEALLIDSERFFQFEGGAINKEVPLITYGSNQIAYDNCVNAEKMRNILNNLWKNAQIPSGITLDMILKGEEVQKTNYSQSTEEMCPSYLKRMTRFNVEYQKQDGIEAKQIILNKIIDVQKFLQDKNTPGAAQPSGVIKGSAANAVIHMPTAFKLPHTLIKIFHIEKQSQLGQEEAMLIYLLLDTPEGSEYLPVTFIGDNPRAQNIWKKYLAGTPGETNVQLMRKDQIHVRIHGNTMFAGWTKPISLIPKRYTLPPACLLIEGYGDIKTDKFVMQAPSGYKTEVERNGYDAFVTFFHPASKYSGPGTDGFFARDYVGTIYSSSRK